MLQVHRLGEVGGQRQRAVLGDVVQPLHDLRDAPARAGDLAGLPEQRDLDLLLRARQRVRHRQGLRLLRQVLHAEPLVQERIALDVDADLEVVRQRVPDLDEAIGQPLPEAVPVEHGHRHVDVRLELDQALARVGHGPVADPDELHPVVLLEGLGERDEVVRVHLEGVGMARVPDDLVRARKLPVHRAGPVPLDRLAEDDHGPAIPRVPLLHVPQHPDDLVVVVPVRDGEDVPAVGRPLVHQAVAVELPAHHAADQRVVDAGVVVGEEDPEALADLERDGLGLQLLSVARAHRELALEGDDLGRSRRRADEVPERGLPGGGGDPDARRPAVDVVRHVRRLDVPGQRADAAPLGLGEQGMVGEPLVREQGLERAGAPPEAERVDRQHRRVGRHVIAPIARRLVPPVHRLAHDHPEGVAGRGAVAGRQHELVGVGVLRSPVVEAQAARGRTRQMGGHVEGRVRGRPAEVPGLRVVPEQRQRHAGHVPDVFESLPLRWRRRSTGRRWQHLAHVNPLSFPCG